MSLLIIGYKRANEIKRVIENVSYFKPKKLFLAMYGPKYLKDNLLCTNAREAALKSINWDCEIQTNFSENNKGLREFILTSILFCWNFCASSKFFPQLAEMIIRSLESVINKLNLT